jgi:hypothetical protein
MALSKAEIQQTRSQLKLRKNSEGHWEVYASVYGTFIFRWWKISDEQMRWYKANFPEIKEVPYE